MEITEVICLASYLMLMKRRIRIRMKIRKDKVIRLDNELLLHRRTIKKYRLTRMEVTRKITRKFKNKRVLAITISIHKYMCIAQTHIIHSQTNE